MRMLKIAIYERKRFSLLHSVAKAEIWQVEIGTIIRQKDWDFHILIQRS